MQDYSYVTNPEKLGAIANEIASAEVVALDLETTGFSPFDCEIRLCSINTGRGIYVIDAFKCGTLESVISALRDTNAVISGQNLKFDQKFLLYKHKLELKKVFDTYRASALIYNGKYNHKGAHDLYALYARELNIAPEAPDLGGSDWSAPELTRDQLDYAAEDVIWLPQLRDILRAKLVSEGLGKVAGIEFQAILPEAEMELNGFPFDKEAWFLLARENTKLADALRKELLAELPDPDRQATLPGFAPEFNLDSHKQLLGSLNMLGMKLDSTAEIELAMKAADFPIIEKILKYREHSQSVKMFGPEYCENVNPVTDRIHTSYYPFTGAGRFASSRPNLQQIPKDKRFRRCFRVPAGKRMVGCDYGQIELRIAAEVANDEALIEAYNRGIDAHTKTASLVSGVPIDQVTKDMRDRAKAVNFGFIYGMSAKKFVLYAQSQYKVSLSLAEATAFRDRFFEGYRGLHAWHREVFDDNFRAKGMSKTIWGRLRYLNPDSYSEYANTPIQGSGADGLKNALRRVYDRLKKYGGRAKMIHMVHDEIILETDSDPEIVAASKKDLEEGMKEGIQPMLKRVPVECEASEGDSWADK